MPCIAGASRLELTHGKPLKWYSFTYHELSGVAIDAVVMNLFVVAMTTDEEPGTAGREQLAISLVMLATKRG